MGGWWAGAPLAPRHCVRLAVIGSCKRLIYCPPPITSLGGLPGPGFNKEPPDFISPIFYGPHGRGISNIQTPSSSYFSFKDSSSISTFSSSLSLPLSPSSLLLQSLPFSPSYSIFFTLPLFLLKLLLRLCVTLSYPSLPLSTLPHYRYFSPFILILTLIHISHLTLFILSLYTSLHHHLSPSFYPSISKTACISLSHLRHPGEYGGPPGPPPRPTPSEPRQ